MIYTVHDFLRLPSGKEFKRGDVLRDADAAEFEALVATEPSFANKATRVDRDPAG